MKNLTDDEASDLYKELFHKYKEELEEINLCIKMDMVIRGYLTPETVLRHENMIKKIKKEAKK